MKTCAKCHEAKPLSEFYAHPSAKDGHHKQCKECAKLYAKKRFKIESKSRSLESRFVEYLNRNGIYATLGKVAGLHAWVDVVAWGCVGIELKSSSLRNKGQFHFQFSKKQIEHMTSQIIVLEFIKHDHNEYYIFRSDDPLFFDSNNKRKGAIFFVDSPKHRSAILARSVLQDALDNLQLIENCRIAEREKLLAGKQPVSLYKREKIAMRQLSLFDVA